MKKGQWSIDHTRPISSFPMETDIKEKQVGGPLNCTNSELDIYLRELEAGYLPTSCSGTNRSLLSKSKTIREKYWSKDKPMESCHSFQPLETYESSTEHPGEEQLMFWPEDFLAKTFQPREQITAKNSELPGSVQAYGENIKGLLEKLNLALSSRKTPPCYALEDLSPSSKTLPAWGMMQDGVSWEVGTSARITKEIEYGYLPTVLATDWKGGTTAIRKDKGRQRFDQWRDYVKIKYGLTYPHPTHSELRMGWPENWTDLKPLETDKFQSWLRSHGKF